MTTQVGRQAGRQVSQEPATRPREMGRVCNFIHLSRGTGLASDGASREKKGKGARGLWRERASFGISSQGPIPHVRSIPTPPSADVTQGTRRTGVPIAPSLWGPVG